MRKDRVCHCDPDIGQGVLVFNGTRVPVQSLFDHLKAGESVKSFLRGFPGVKREQAEAVLEERQQRAATRMSYDANPSR